jgi:hypothetical protein
VSYWHPAYKNILNDDMNIKGELLKGEPTRVRGEKGDGDGGVDMIILYE